MTNMGRDDLISQVETLALTGSNETCDWLTKGDKHQKKSWDDDVAGMKKEFEMCVKNVAFHVTEVYSKPRVTEMAKLMKMTP